MGTSCGIANCVQSLIFEKEIYVRGHKIFKPIFTKLEIDQRLLTQGEQESLRNYNELLEQAENKRKEIAEKFEKFLYETGACVLTQPTIERGLTTYIVNIITQIIICAKAKSVEFDINDFSIIKLISLSNKPPFFQINQETLDNFKNKYGFDFNVIDSLIKGKDSIIAFFRSIPDAKELFFNVIKGLKEILEKNMTNLAILKQIYKSKDALIFLYHFFLEVTGGLISLQEEFAKTSKLQLFVKIANKAAENKIQDPKEIALRYAFGDNCGSVENWKENMVYKEEEPVKY